MKRNIGVIAGDGTGKEVVPAAMRVADHAAELHGFAIEWTEYPWSCDYYLRHGRMMPPDGLRQLAGHDGILLGAVGQPDVPDHVSLWGLLIPIRRAFHRYVNLRPCRLLPGLAGPLRDAAADGVDLVVVRFWDEIFREVAAEYLRVGARDRAPGTSAATWAPMTSPT